MIIRFTASSIVAMILFIPLLIALGLILAFIVPLLAVIAAVAGILFLGAYTFAKIGLVKPKSSGTRKSAEGRLRNRASPDLRLGPVDASRLGKQRVEIGSDGSRRDKRAVKALDVKDYKVR